MAYGSMSDDGSSECLRKILCGMIHRSLFGACCANLDDPDDFLNLAQMAETGGCVTNPSTHVHVVTRPGERCERGYLLAVLCFG